jgi:ABC-type lipoprotein release transport system permease subunit
MEDGIAESQRRLAESEKAAAAELSALEDETRRAMLGLGFNLAIVDRKTDLIDFLSTRLPTETMPQDHVDRLAADPNLTMVTHIVATLHEEISWQDPTGKERRVRLIAYLPETTQSHKRHPKPMGYSVEPGTVFLGYLLRDGKKVGDSIEVMGEEFRVAQILTEKGTHEDTSIIMHLEDGQRLLNRPKEINQILALECRCAESDLPAIRKQVSDILPETVVIRDMARANARSRQRALVSQKHDAIRAKHQNDLQERTRAQEATRTSRQKIQENMEALAAVVMVLVVLVAAIWLGLLALGNVHDRRREIGLLRALGKNSGHIAFLFLGKAVVLGLLGALLGFVLGAGMGFALGTEMTQLLGIRPLYAAKDHFVLPIHLLWFALVGASLLSLLASYLPTLIALRQDPAVVLREA